MTAKSAAELWGQYLLLSKEMLRFLHANNIDEFLELHRQRVEVFRQMKAAGLQALKATDEGRATLPQLKPVDMQIIYGAKAWLNKSRRQTALVKGYGGIKGAPAGVIFNREM